jgi:hypothetical protein
MKFIWWEKEEEVYLYFIIIVYDYVGHIMESLLSKAVVAGKYQKLKRERMKNQLATEKKNNLNSVSQSDKELFELHLNGKTSEINRDALTSSFGSNEVQIQIPPLPAQLVAMSATIPNLQELSEWIGALLYTGFFAC